MVAPSIQWHSLEPYPCWKFLPSTLIQPIMQTSWLFFLLIPWAPLNPNLHLAWTNVTFLLFQRQPCNWSPWLDFFSNPHHSPKSSQLSSRDRNGSCCSTVASTSPVVSSSALITKTLILNLPDKTLLCVSPLLMHAPHFLSPYTAVTLPPSVLQTLCLTQSLCKCRAACLPLATTSLLHFMEFRWIFLRKAFPETSLTTSSKNNWVPSHAFCSMVAISVSLWRDLTNLCLYI